MCLRLTSSTNMLTIRCMRSVLNHLIYMHPIIAPLQAVPHFLQLHPTPSPCPEYEYKTRSCTYTSSSWGSLRQPHSHCPLQGHAHALIVHTGRREAMLELANLGDLRITIEIWGTWELLSRFGGVGSTWRNLAYSPRCPREPNMPNHAKSCQVPCHLPDASV